VKRRLAPWTYPGDIVVMDNLNIHKMHVVREAILDAGGFPVYLPTYSPELNPIERLWADIKRRLCSPSLRTTSSYEQCIGFALRHPSRRSLRGFGIRMQRLRSTDPGDGGDRHVAVEDDRIIGTVTSTVRRQGRCTVLTPRRQLQRQLLRFWDLFRRASPQGILRLFAYVTVAFAGDAGTIGAAHVRK
jgi:transposase